MFMRASVHMARWKRASPAGKRMVKRRALADRALDLEPAAHGARSGLARLEGADAEAALLGRGEGLEQAGADEVGRHARRRGRRPRSATSPPLSKQRSSTGVAGRWRRSRSGRDGRAPARGRTGSPLRDQPGVALERDRMGRGASTSATASSSRPDPDRPTGWPRRRARRAARGGRAGRSSSSPRPAGWRSCRRGTRDCRHGARRCGRPATAG